MSRVCLDLLPTGPKKLKNYEQIITPLLFISFVLSLAITESLRGMRRSHRGLVWRLISSVYSLMQGYNPYRNITTGSERVIDRGYGYEPSLMVQLCLEDAGDLWISYWAHLAVISICLFFFIMTCLLLYTGWALGYVIKSWILAFAATVKLALRQEL